MVHPVLVRADSAGAVRAFIDGLGARNCEFSVSARTSDTLDGIRTGPWQSWDLNRLAFHPDLVDL